MRDRFEQTRQEKDMRKLAAMVEEGEEEAWRNQHFQPFVFRVIIPNLMLSQYYSLLTSKGGAKLHKSSLFRI